MKNSLYGGETPSASSSSNFIEGTNNVAMDGNYNVQVLTKALENYGNFEIDSIEKPGVKQTNESF